MTVNRQILGLGCLMLCVTGCASTRGTAEIAATAPAPDAAVCAAHTGSRLPRAGADCAAGVRSYSGDDLRRTGAATAGQALRLLDTTVTVQ